METQVVERSNNCRNNLPVFFHLVITADITSLDYLCLHLVITANITSFDYLCLHLVITANITSFD